MFEYYIIIMFLRRKAKPTIHVTVAARNNSTTKSVEKIVASLRPATNLHIVRHKKTALCERGLQQNLNPVSGYDMALIRADNRDSRRLTVLR